MAGKDGFWDKVIDRSFIRDGDGRLAYYPWGPTRQGYWVETTDQEQSLRAGARLRLTMLRILVPGNFVLPLFGLLGDDKNRAWFIALPVYAVAMLWIGALSWHQRRSVGHLTAALPRQSRLPQPHAPRRLLRHMAAAIPIWSPIVLLLILIPGGIHVARTAVQSGDIAFSTILALMLCVALGVCLVLILIMKLRLRWSDAAPSASENDFTSNFLLARRLMRPGYVIAGFLIALLLLAGLLTLFAGR